MRVPQKHTLPMLQMKFQPMSNKDPAARSPPPSQDLWAEEAENVQQKKKDQLRMSDETGGHLEAIMSDILM